MSELISRQAAMDLLGKQIEQCDRSLSSFDISMKDEYAVKVEKASLTAFRERLEYLPPAQPEIIRCKDCKHLFNKDDEGGKCWHFNGFSKVVSYDDFCSLAERRTDGQI